MGDASSQAERALQRLVQREQRAPFLGRVGEPPRDEETALVGDLHRRPAVLMGDREDDRAVPDYRVDVVNVAWHGLLEDAVRSLAASSIERAPQLVVAADLLDTDR